MVACGRAAYEKFLVSMRTEHKFRENRIFLKNRQFEGRTAAYIQKFSTANKKEMNFQHFSRSLEFILLF